MNNKHSLIIGGTKGLGRVTAKILATEKHTVSVIARQKPEESQQIESVNYWEADLAKSDRLPEVMNAIIQKSGPLTNLVFFQRYRGKDDEWQGEIDTALTGTKTIIELAAPNFKTEGGSIVLISSVNASLITKHLPVGYHLAKAGLHQLVRYYAVMLGPRGIRVNGISPGTLLKEESKDFFLKNNELLELYRKMIPLGRLGTAEELGNTILYLCGSGASYLTGQDLVLDGGLSLLWQEALVRGMIPSPLS